MGGLMQPNRQQIVQYYRQALQRCLDTFALLDEKEWGKKASDHWTAKEHLAHLVSTHEQETLVLTRQALAGEPASIPGFEKREDMLPFRQKNMEALRDLPVSELLKRFRQGFEEHMALMEGLSEADLDKPAMSPGWDRPGKLRDLFFASYLFLPSQYQDIRKVAKKKLPHWVEASSPDEINFHLGRTFHYMPLIFWSSKGADMKATYLFTMEGQGGGQWSVQVADGQARAADGPPQSADLEFKTKPHLWMDLSRGDLNPMFAIATRKVHLGGNPALAMKLSELFSVA